MAKPDDRSDNVARLQENIENTEANMQEANEYLNEFADEISAEEKQAIKAKNERREESIQGFAAEKQDEAGQ
ncbi:small acid-soluble spore protein Tlp [Paenibacillus harenae]|uniref:small acid-soluble spore protein Tlp n=1 Tax=Paenibacillus harenae TaxID=306543 RepID=UPI0004166F7F|nr:small acid-soluble spore protein Tlp [Paenibacillus harenae]